MSSPGKDGFIFCETSKQQLKLKRIDETVKEVGQAIRKLLLTTILQSKNKGKNKRTERLISSLGKC